MRALTYPHHLARQAVLLLTVSYLAGCANPTKAPSTRCAQVNYPVHDPAERVNRSVFAFNRAVDNYALAPVTRSYRSSRVCITSRATSASRRYLSTIYCKATHAVRSTPLAVLQ